MCALCSKYGTKFLSNEELLKKALGEAGRLLNMKLTPKMRDHVLEFIDKLMGETEVDKGVEEAWESNRDA